jgi:hypothetical protein
VYRTSVFHLFHKKFNVQVGTAIIHPGLTCNLYNIFAEWSQNFHWRLYFVFRELFKEAGGNLSMITKLHRIYEITGKSKLPKITKFRQNLRVFPEIKKFRNN